MKRPSHSVVDALVEDTADLRGQLALLPHTRDELILVQVIGDLTIGNIAEFGAVLQVIDHDDVGMTAVVEGLDQIAANEAGAASIAER